MFATTLVRDRHVRSFQVRLARAGGWEAWERVDQQIVEQQRHTDWQRVEQTLARYAREIKDLLEQGWSQTAIGSP